VPMVERRANHGPRPTEVSVPCVCPRGLSKGVYSRRVGDLALCAVLERFTPSHPPERPTAEARRCALSPLSPLALPLTVSPSCVLSPTLRRAAQTQRHQISLWTLLLILGPLVAVAAWVVASQSASQSARLEALEHQVVRDRSCPPAPGSRPCQL